MLEFGDVFCYNLCSCFNEILCVEVKNLLKDIISKYASDFVKGQSTELRLQQNLTRRAIMQNGLLVGNTRSSTKGVSARVYQNGVYGFASAGELSDEAVKATLENASFNAKFLDGKIKKGRAALPSIASEDIGVQKDMTDVPQSVYIDFVKALDSYVAKKYPKLLMRGIYAVADSMEKIILTSDGCRGHIIAPRSYVYVFMNAEGKDGQPVELFKVMNGGRGTFDLNYGDPSLLYAKIDALYEKIMQKAEGVHADAGTKTCILGGELSGMLAHEAVGHTVEADLVLGGSVAKYMLHKQVASPLVSMVDFAHTAFGETAPLPVYMDDEGVKAEDVVLIKDGILTGYMVNRDMGETVKMAPKGNARAWSFSDEPLIRMRNTAVLPGTSKLEDMISSVEDGYYLVDTNNGQADTTGEFMFGISMGYEIKKGKIGKAILDTTISGVAFEMLKTVDMVGDSVSWSSSGFCGKKQPMPVGLGGPALKCKVTIGGR